MEYSICIISTRAPYNGQFAREALDAALVSASYDIDTHLLMMGDGVFQLIKGQDSTQVDRKNFSSMLKALPLYGVDEIHVDQASLDACGLKLGELLDGVVALKTEELPMFIQQHTRVLNF
ncbi:MAG: sulfurtransferase complex subunit TusC [Endozoicomonas sp.]